MLITRQPDGSLLVECRGDQFSAAWKVATVAQRVVLPDKRPAVRKEDELGVTYTTIHYKAWDIVQYLKRHGKLKTVPQRRQCEFCHSELKVVREVSKGYWTFSCPNCHSVEIHDKKLIGGTFNQGENEKR